jgi:hypothetical protein
VLIAAVIRLINFKAIDISLGFALVLLVGQVEHIAIGASDLEAKGLLASNLIL